MRWNGFGPGLAFAAAAAAAYALFALAVPLPRGASLAAFSAIAIPLYVAGLGPRLRAGMGGALLAAILCGGAAVTLPPREALIVSAVSLGLVRSGLLYRARFARAVVLEGALVVGGLAIARHLLGASALSSALAVWGFFLVQSVFFLVGGVTARRESSTGGDPFEEARARALAVIGER